jgi:CcmD family protein
MENAGYLWAVLGLIWALVFGYVLILIRREKRLQEEIKSLKEVLGGK